MLYCNSEECEIQNYCHSHINRLREQTHLALDPREKDIVAFAYQANLHNKPECVLNLMKEEKKNG